MTINPHADTARKLAQLSRDLFDEVVPADELPTRLRGLAAHLNRLADDLDGDNDDAATKEL